MNGPVRLHSNRDCLVHLLVATLLWLALGGRCTGAGTEAAEGGKNELTPTEFKAAFLNKIPILVSWPTSAFAGTNTNIVIAVLGPDPFGGLLEKLSTNQKVGGRSIVVRTDVTPLSLTNCHVLFVPADQQPRWLEWKRSVGDSGTAGMLTIGEDAEFLRSGGIIKLLPEKRVFELHLPNANAQGDRLRLDPKLKRSAKLVR